MLNTALGEPTLFHLLAFLSHAQVSLAVLLGYRD